MHAPVALPALSTDSVIVTVPVIAPPPRGLTEAAAIAEARRLKLSTGYNHGVWEMPDGTFVAQRSAYGCKGAVRHVGSYVQDNCYFLRAEA